jgi:metal-responsive CopG/Arc/MetJ family transcriptional regulator
MQTNKKLRQSVTLPEGVAQRVSRLAKTQRTSTSRVLVELIETGLEAKEAEKQRFFALADRLATASGPEKEKIKKELAKLTFGE